MSKNSFKGVAADENNPLYNKLTERKTALYGGETEIRSPFARDYTRILHSTAFRRLKHKTQVFYNIENDHVCTRMEHVSHVESVSYTVAKYLGLNEELTKAIAMGHDLGHAPFGHHGEKIIDGLCEKYLGEHFFHEKNGLYFADKIELLPDHDDDLFNLNLTYAVRDGIISHCGEADLNGIKPRTEPWDLSLITAPGQYAPSTYEGCVVKAADKIAYVGRDIEDAINLNFLSEKELKELSDANLFGGGAVNTGTIMSDLIHDICENSTPEKGIMFSEKSADKLNRIKDFNYKYIYDSKRFNAFKRYSELIITEIFDTLFSCFDKENSFDVLLKKQAVYPDLISDFISFAEKYCYISAVPQADAEKVIKCHNDKIYGDFSDKKTYARAVIDYIAGMTDRYAVKIFNGLITY